MNTQKNLRDRIMRFFRDNPEETLTVDDIDEKFDGGFHLEDVLDSLEKEKLLWCNRDTYSLPKSQQPKSALKTTPAPKKEVKVKRQRGWKPKKLLPKLKLAEPPIWITTNQPRYQPKNKYDRDTARLVVQVFWDMAHKGESCELWCNYDTGEKAIFEVGKMPDRSWMPLMRSSFGKVKVATNVYSFPVA